MNIDTVETAAGVGGVTFLLGWLLGWLLLARPRPLPLPEPDARRPPVAIVVPARADESIAEFSKRTGNEWNIQQTAVMNDVFANERLEAGRLMKIAVSQPHRSGDAR